MDEDDKCREREAMIKTTPSRGSVDGKPPLTQLQPEETVGRTNESNVALCSPG